MEYKNYRLRYFEKYDRYETFKPRPYDDNEYYWATTKNMKSWNVYYNGRHVISMNGTFREVIDYLENLNQKIEPRMCHN